MTIKHIHKLNRKFLVNIAFLVLLNLLIKPFWFFGIEVAVQNRVGNDAYGLYYSLLSFSLILNFILDLGITNFNNREIARHNQMVSKYFSHIIGLKLLLGLLYSAICFTVGYFVGYSLAQLSIILLLIFNQFLFSFILYLRSTINGLLMFVTDSIMSVLDKALMILLLGFMLWTNVFEHKFNIHWFIYAQTTSYIITATVALIIVLKKCAYFKPQIDLRYLKIILKKSFPFSILVLLMFLYNRIEPVLLERLLPDGKTQAGIYAQGYRILEVLSNFSYLFPVLLLPLFSKMLKFKDNLASLVSLAFSLMVIPAIIVSSACSVYGSQLMDLLYHQPQNGHIFSILILGFTGITITYLYGTLLTANGNLWQLNIMSVCAVVTNISLNFILIPLFKAEGAAWTSFITQTITALVQLILAYKIIGIETNKKVLLKIAIWGISFVTTIILVKQIEVNWVTGFALIVASGLFFALILKLIKIKEIIVTLTMAQKEAKITN
jgi:O-antigen/teichoic acid export membrane protein